MYGYTKREAFERYLLVDKETNSFSYRRLKYNQAHYDPLKGFVEKHGLPDFIYEFKNEIGRDGIKMFYMAKDVVYVFVKGSWSPGSMYLYEHRPLTEHEKLTYKELNERR